MGFRTGKFSLRARFSSAQAASLPASLATELVAWRHDFQACPYHIPRHFAIATGCDLKGTASQVEEKSVSDRFVSGHDFSRADPRRHLTSGALGRAATERSRRFAKRRRPSTGRESWAKHTQRSAPKDGAARWAKLSRASGARIRQNSGLVAGAYGLRATRNPECPVRSYFRALPTRVAVANISATVSMSLG